MYIYLWQNQIFRFGRDTVCINDFHFPVLSHSFLKIHSESLGFIPKWNFLIVTSTLGTILINRCLYDLKTYRRKFYLNFWALKSMFCTILVKSFSGEMPQRDFLPSVFLLLGWDIQTLWWFVWKQRYLHGQAMVLLNTTYVLLLYLLKFFLFSI